jgi:hypothetical protein
MDRVRIIIEEFVLLLGFLRVRVRNRVRVSRVKVTVRVRICGSVS